MSEIQGSITRLLSAPIMHIDPTNPLDDQNHTRNFIVEAVNAEKKLWKLIHCKDVLHGEVQKLYREARSSYEKIILNDHELAELQDIEYSLWKLHYKHIDEYRNVIRESSVNNEHINLATVQNVASMHQKRYNLLEGFKSFLSEATEFYRDLIKKIRRSNGLPGELLFFNESGFSNSMDSTRMQRCQFSCHRCLVCLGDLARYKELYGNPDGQNRNWSVAARHYLNASTIWPDSGNPHNQLAVLAIYVGDELLALYHCIRSLAVKEPFPDAWENLILLFEKNRSSHLRSLSKEATFNFFKPSEKMTMQPKAQSSESFSNCQLREANGDVSSEQTELWSLIVRMISFFYVKPSSEDFPHVFGSTIRELEVMLSLDDSRLKIALESYQHMDVARTGPFRVLQLVSVLIFTIHVPSENSKIQKAKHIKYMQQPSLKQQAFTSTFICMGRLVNRCMMANPVDCSSLLPAILVFVEWLVDMLDRAETYATDEKCASAMGYFFNAFVDLLNQFDDKGSETESPDFSILWEDNELRGFSPISQLHGPLDFKTRPEARSRWEDRNESQVRISRIFVAAMKIVNRSIGTQKWICYEKIGRKFYTTESKKLPCRRGSEAAEAGLDIKVRELQQQCPVSKDVVTLQEGTKDCEVLISEDGENKLDMHSSPVEEEEVILFKPLTRYNSAPLYLPVSTTCQVPGEGLWDLAAPSSECLHRVSSLHLPQNEIRIDPLNVSSNITGSSNKTFWQEPIPEDSVMDSFTESTESPRFRENTKTEELTSLTGPPSLSAWVLNKENLGVAGGKMSSRRTEDIASAYLTGLSIGGNKANQQDVDITSYAPESHFMRGSPYGRNSVSDHRYSSETTNYMAPPYMSPVPSAPLLPDNATWFSGNSSNYAEHKDLEDMDGYFPGAAQVNSYSNLTGTQGNPNLGLGVPRFSHGFTPYSGRINSSQWLPQYPVNHDRAHDQISPIHVYTPTTLGRFHDSDGSRITPCDLRTIPLPSSPMNHLEDLPYHPGFRVVNGADEQKKETLFHGYTGQSPYGYGAAKNLRSEQQLLLQYLKEKEWHLLQEAQLRGPA